MAFRRSSRPSRFARPLSLTLLEAREVPTVSSFQNGVGGYTGTKDTYINAASTGTSYAATTTITIANPSATINQTQGLLRFDSIIGTGAGQIPAGSIIVSASLTLNTTTAGDGATFHRMLVPWSDTLTYAAAGSGTGGFNGTAGIQLGSSSTGEALNTYFANAGDPGSRNSDPAAGSDSFGVTDDVQAWANGSPNYGWLLNPNTSNTTAFTSWLFSSSETATVTARPQLSVVWIPATNVTAAVFQQGTNGYTGVQDTQVFESSPTTNYSASTTFGSDARDNATTTNETQGAIRFANLFGSAAGQVPAGATIIGATLSLASNLSNGRGNGGRFYRFTQNYDFSTLTWNGTASGAGFKIGTDTLPGYQSAAGLTPKPESGLNAFDVTNDISVWAKGTEPNNGWAILPFDGGTDGWFVQSSETAVPTVSVNAATPQAFNPRPKLTIYYTPPGVEPPAAQLDVTTGLLTYTGGSKVANNVSVTLTGGNYVVTDPADTITLSANAQAAGWTVEGNVATGPAASVSAGLTFSTGTAVDTITLGDVSVPVTVDGGNNAGDNVVFNGAVTVAGGKVVVDRVTGVSQAANTTITVGTLTLTADTIGSSAAPLTVAAASIGFTGGAAGVYIATPAGGTVGGTGASGPVSITNATGTLTVGANITTSAGNITVTSGDALVVNADIGTTAGKISLLANADGAGTQGYTQSTTARLLSASTAADAVSVAVNTAAGGTGDAVLGQGSITLGTLTVNSNAGSILWNPGFTIPAINASNSLVLAAGAFAFVTSGAGSSVGTSAAPLQTGSLVTSLAGLTSAAAGTGGVYITEWTASTGYFTAKAQGAGNVQIIAANSAGNNIYVAPAGITTGSGNITLLADDDQRVYGPIGGPGFSGKILLEANRDGGNAQQFQQYEDATAGYSGYIQTSNASADALVIRTYPTSTSSVTVGGIILGNVSIGSGGTAVFDAAGLLNAGTGSDTIRAGTIVQALGAKIDAGTGTVYLNAKDNPIGIAVSQPITVIASKVIAGTNSAAIGSSSLGGNQQPGNVNIVSPGTVSIQAQTSTAGSGTATTAGTVYLEATAGTLSVDGLVHTDSGAITLKGGTAVALNADVTSTSGDISLTAGLGGVTQTAGKVATAGALTFAGGGPVVFASTGNSAATVNLTGGSLRVNGGFGPTNAFVAADGTLVGGSGTIGLFTAGGNSTFDIGSAGNTVGALATGDITLTGTTAVPVQINGPAAGTGYDQLVVTGAVTLNGAKLQATLGYSPAAADTITLVSNDSTDAVNGTFDGLAEGATLTLNATNYLVSYKGGDGNDVTLTPLNGTAGDTQVPTAAGTFAAVTNRKGATYTFTVTLSDNVAVLASSVQGADFTVTGPNGYSKTATLVSLSPNADGSPLVATLSVPAPGGSFDVSDNGTYTVSVTGSITDTATTPNAVATGSVGTFAVQAPVSVESVVTKLSDGTTTSLTTGGQRSLIPNLVVTYDGLATGANLAAAYKLLNTSTNATVALTATTTTVGGKTVATISPTQPLANAYYTFTAFGTAVTTTNLSPLVVGLDGDNNGTAEGNFALDFHRFAGDVTGDTAVDGDDLAFLAAAFNSVDGDSTYRAFLDLDGDGAVDGNDLAIFAQSFALGIL